MCARSEILKFKGVSDLKTVLEFEDPTWSLESYFFFLPKQSCFTDWEAGVALSRPHYTAKRTRKILISNIHLLSSQKWSQFVHFNIEKVYLRGQP